MNNDSFYRRQQTGISLISVLVAILIFSFGSVALVKAYVQNRSVITDNQAYQAANNLAESLRGLLASSNSQLIMVNNISTDSYAATNTTLLGVWANRVKTELPTGKGTVVVVDPKTLNTTGSNCAANTPCTLRLTLTWKRDIQRTQTYLLQIGF